MCDAGTKARLARWNASNNAEPARRRPRPRDCRHSSRHAATGHQAAARTSRPRSSASRRTPTRVAATSSPAATSRASTCSPTGASPCRWPSSSGRMPPARPPERTGDDGGASQGRQGSDPRQAGPRTDVLADPKPQRFRRWRTSAPRMRRPRLGRSADPASTPTSPCANLARTTAIPRRRRQRPSASDQPPPRPPADAAGSSGVQAVERTRRSDATASNASDVAHDDEHHEPDAALENLTDRETPPPLPHSTNPSQLPRVTDPDCLPCLYSLLILLLDHLPLAAAPPPALPHLPGLPPDLSGRSRKGGPARSGGPPFLESPGGMRVFGPEAGRRPVDLQDQQLQINGWRSTSGDQQCRRLWSPRTSAPHHGTSSSATAPSRGPSAPRRNDHQTPSPRRWWIGHWSRTELGGVGPS